MKHFGSVTLLGLFLTVAACEESEVSPISQKLVGTWQLYEYGWSPGSGYFVENVPSVPAQTITFRSNGTVDVKGEQLGFFDSHRQYRLVNDSTQATDYVAFSGSDTNDNESIAYITLLTSDSLTLSPPCFEGCHYDFVRVNQPVFPKNDF